MSTLPETTIIYKQHVILPQIQTLVIGIYGIRMITLRGYFAFDQRPYIEVSHLVQPLAF